jgi:hypothetical protein
MATATALRLRSPSPAFSLLDARCGDEDFGLEGAGFEELLRTFGAGLDSPAAGLPAGEAGPQAQDDLALALVAPLPLSLAAHAPGPAPGLRCLDERHGGRSAGSCACTAPPLEAEEALYELVGDTGKKNGEKRCESAQLAQAPHCFAALTGSGPSFRRLRSQISRTPEWRSLAERERLARMCDAAVPARASLANALRLRHCTLLRKGDLLFLARAWGYQSDIWGHRKDRRGGRGPPLDAASTAVVPHTVSDPSLSRLAATQPEAQLAEVRAALAGPLRALAERGIAAFAGFEGVTQRVAQLSRLPGSDAQLRALGPYARVLVDIGTRRQQGALAEIKRLQTALQAQHADVQLRMLRMDATQAARPAFLALAAEAEAPWEPVFRDVAKLCHSAMLTTCAAVINLGVTVELPARTAAEAAALDALTAGYDADGISRGGELSLELLTRAHGVLHAMRLAPLETYLAALAGVLSLLVGHMAGCADAMSQQCEHCLEARDALAALYAQ